MRCKLIGFFVCLLFVGTFFVATPDIISLINPEVNHMGSIAGQPVEPSIFEDFVSVRGTFLFADNEVTEWDDNGDGVNESHSVEAPLIVNLSAHGFKPGDLILISGRGELHYAAPFDWNLVAYGSMELLGVFSSTDAVLWESGDDVVGPLHRVPGAINAGKPYNTKETFNGNPNDIPEDFFISGFNTTIRIPPGAVFLMLGSTDYKLTDNDGWIMVTIQKDTDGDGLWDSWETKGIDANNDGTIDLTLEGADWQHKDIYVEVDYMEGHKPDQGALDDVKATFHNCPATVAYSPINLHIEVDSTTPAAHSDYIRFEWINNFKATSGFGTYDQRHNENSDAILLAKKYAYHYCLFVHCYEYKNGSVWTKTTSGGLGECPGNDFMVSMGGWTNGVGSREEQAAAFMHELGHNLGLRHGGSDDVNYKPNYLSIMNYQFYLPNVLKGRPLTYSSAKLRTLTESNLDETTGVNWANWDWTVYSALLQTTNGSKYVPLAVSTLGAIDWDNDGDEIDRSTQANINNWPQRNYANTDDQILYGFDDWSNLNFRFTETGAFNRGLDAVNISDYDMTWEFAQAMAEEAKNMVGGPTGPVQILTGSPVNETVSDQPSPQEKETSSIDTTTLAIVATVVVMAVVIGLFFMLRKRNKQ
jgi:hypothetical protein